MTGLSRPLRVLHCPTNVGGHPSTLVAAERKLGMDSRLLVLTPSPFGYEGEEALTRAGAGIARTEAARLQLLTTAVRWADVVHFNFGSGIFPPDTAPTPKRNVDGWHRAGPRALYQFGRRHLSGRDLRLLAALGKRVVVTFQGDDVRPTAGHPGGLSLDTPQDLRKQRLVAQFDAVAASMFALNPDLLDHLPTCAEFLPYANIDLDDLQPTSVTERQVLRVAHAPTNRAVKGTDDVLAGVEVARAAGTNIQLDVIEGATTAEVRARIAQADVVIDQLRIGWYGGLAVEAMALGVPVFAHIDKRQYARLPAGMADDIPIVSVTSTTLADELVRFAQDGLASRRAAATRSRSYVEQWHHPSRVAARTRAAYQQATTH
jgi:hypothetical protein